MPIGLEVACSASTLFLFVCLLQAEALSQYCTPDDQHNCTYTVGVEAVSNCSYFIQVRYYGGRPATLIMRRAVVIMSTLWEYCRRNIVKEKLRDHTVRCPLPVSHECVPSSYSSSR